MLVQFSFFAAINKAAERWLSKYIPGYDTYKAMAEEKLSSKLKILPYSSALINQQGYWQLAYIVEQDAEGNYVVFVPNTPDTKTGHVLLAKHGQVRVVSSITANQLDASLKNMGKGLLNEHGIHRYGGLT